MSGLYATVSLRLYVVLIAQAKRAADNICIPIPKMATAGSIPRLQTKNINIKKFRADSIDIAFSRQDKLPSDGK